MTGLDIAITITVLLAAVIGFWRGILRPVIGIAGFLAGLVLAAAWYSPLADALWPGAGAWASVASYVIILLVVLVLTAIVGGIVSRTVHATPFGIVDRLIGLVVAILLSLAAWVLLLGIVTAMVPNAAQAVSESPLATLLLGLLPGVSSAQIGLALPV